MTWMLPFLSWDTDATRLVIIIILLLWEQTVSLRLKWLWLLRKKNCTLESRKFFIDRLMNTQSYLSTIVIFSSTADTFINMWVIRWYSSWFWQLIRAWGKVRQNIGKCAMRYAIKNKRIWDRLCDGTYNHLPKTIPNFHLKFRPKMFCVPEIWNNWKGFQQGMPNPSFRNRDSTE